MLKKSFVFIFSIILASCILVGCGGASSYDDKALKDRIDELEGQVGDLEEQVGDLQDELNTLKPANKVYQFGETATVYINGVAAFQIKYTKRITSNEMGYFDFINISIAPGIKISELIGSRSYNSSTGESISNSTKSTEITLSQTPIKLADFSFGVVTAQRDRIIFYSASYVTYAVFAV